MLLACTLLKYYSPEDIIVPSIHYNYPLPLHNSLGSQAAKRLRDIAVLHYHRELRNHFWFANFEVETWLQKWIVKTLYE